MEALGGGTVVRAIERNLDVRERQDLRAGELVVDGALRPIEALEAGQEAIPGLALRERLLDVTGVPAIVDVEARHLVEPDQQVEAFFAHALAHRLCEVLVLRVTIETHDRHDLYFQPRLLRTLGRLPAQREDLEGMSAPLALRDDLHEIALDAAIGEVLKNGERQAH